MMKKLKKERKFLGNTLVSKQEAGVFDAKLFLLCAMHIDLVVVLANCHHGAASMQFGTSRCTQALFETVFLSSRESISDCNRK